MDTTTSPFASWTTDYEPPRKTVFGGQNESPATYVTWKQAWRAGSEDSAANVAARCMGECYPNACWSN